MFIFIAALLSTEKKNIEIVQISIDKRMDNLVTERSDNGILCSNKNENLPKPLTLLGCPGSLFRFFYKMLWNKLFGQPNTMNFPDSISLLFLKGNYCIWLYVFIYSYSFLSSFVWGFMKRI